MKIEAKGIGFRYENGPWLFQGVDLTLHPGEIVGITGPSGCGKTAFCRILAGYEQPAEGTITFGCEPLRKVGYQPIQLIFQHPEKAVNPRWKMKKLLTKDGILIKSYWIYLVLRRNGLSAGQMSYPVGSCSDSALRGLWDQTLAFLLQMK